MSVLKVVVSILFIGFLIHLYVNYLPTWVSKFQEMVLNEPVKEKQQDKKEGEEQKVERPVDKDKEYEKKADEEIKRILGIKEEEKKNEGIIDKILNYIKMLKEKFL